MGHFELEIACALLFSAYQSNAKVETTKSSKVTNKTKEAVHNGIVLVFLLVDARNCECTNRANYSWSLPKYVPCSTISDEQN